MKHIYPFLLIIALIFLCSHIVAQQGTVIRGRIVDKITGDPLPGVNIIEVDEDNRVVKGVITDVNGDYVFEATNVEHMIKFSFVGYKSQTYPIQSRTRIDVELEQKSTELEQVTVVAEARGNEITGVSERDQTGSTAQVDMEKLSGSAGVSAASALQGQVSGLDIMSASGTPGSGSSIVIRGMGSLGNTNPLIVIDGIPQDIKTEDFNFASADQHDLGQLLNIAPQDIKSVEVLKDAASTAVWGSKGANGVLIIETHKGEKGNIKFNYQYKLSANIQPPQIPMLNGDEYITMQMEEWHNAQSIYEVPQEIAYNRNYADFFNYSANTNWLKRITKDSYSNNLFFKMSGGGRQSRYYTSINYEHDDGTTINTSFQRFSVRANFDYSISDNLRFTTNFSYTNTFRENNPQNIRKMAYIKAPNMSIWEFDEHGKPTGEYFTPIESYQGSGTDYFNPVAVSNLGTNDVQGNQIQNNFKINWNILDWLKFKETISFSYANDKGNRFLPSPAIGADWLNGQINHARERNTMDTRWLSRSQLFFSPFRGSKNHSLTGVAMWTMEQKKWELINLVTHRGPTFSKKDPAMGAPVANTVSRSSLSRLYGALGSLLYKYKDRYILNLNLRGDASSAFGESNQWGIFPSVSFGWRFSDETFLESLKILDDSKLRFGWGQSGKGIDDTYATYSFYESSGRYIENPVIIPDRIQLSNLRWQTVSSWNAGLDLNLFRYRLNITADIYRKVTEDLLWEDYSIPESSGYATLNYFNGGKIENVGWEFFINAIALDQDDLKFSLNFNISQNVNSFLSFPDNFQKERGISIGNGIYPRKAEVGKPIGSFYGFRYLGVYATDEDAVARNQDGQIMKDANGNPIRMTYMETYEFKAGDAIYEDINHDGKIDIMDAVYIGNSSPEFIGGFGTTLNYKQITASLNFHYRLGFDIVNEVAIETEGMLDRNNQSKAVLRRWRRYGQDEKGMLPRAYLNHPCNNLGSDRYVERGDFLRLNSINLSYRFDSKKIKQRFKINSLDLGVTLRNVLTLTNYSGQDPEIGRVGRNPFFLGRDNARTPPPRMFSVRVNLNF